MFNPAEGASMGKAAQKSLILERMARPPTHSSTLTTHKRERPKTLTAFVSLSGMCHDPKKDPNICLVNPPLVGVLSSETHTARRDHLCACLFILRTAVMIGFQRRQRAAQNISVFS